MVKLLQFMATWGVWDIVSLLITLIPVVFLAIYLFPRRHIKNLYIDTHFGRANHPYDKVIIVEIRNHTNTTVYVLSEGFQFGNTIRLSQFGAKNANTGTYEIKFEGREQGRLSDIDTLIRPNQLVSTWIPVHNDEPEDKINHALASKSVGTLILKALKIQEGRDAFVKLKIKV